MVLVQTVHPSPAQLRAFGQGRLSADEAAVLEKHLTGCDTCCQALEPTDTDSFVGRLRRARDPSPEPTDLNDAGPGEAEAVPDIPTALARHLRYRMRRLLGQGGMGAVYLAEHRQMGRSVALKVINPSLLSHPGALSRFQQEVRAAARLDHPNIVAAFDADHAAGLHFLVMEYVEGQNMADFLLEHGPLSPAEACDVGRQAALGLQHAHERGMIHRDIKPHNLMRTPEGRIKVLDFGLARLAAETAEAGSDGAALTPHLTGAGAVLGTADYIAPEQARDARCADARSDVYSLGCTLYHCLAGRPPFPEGTCANKLARHAAEPPRSLRELRPDVPEPLADAIARMMAKRPEDRYPTAAAVVTALSARQQRPRRRFLVALIALVLVVTAGAAATVMRLPAGDDQELVIETDDSTLSIVVRGDHIVRITDPKTGKAYHLDRDKLTLALADDPDGLTVTLNGIKPVVLKRNGKKIAAVWLEPKGAAAKAPPAPGPFQPLFNGRDLTGWVVDGGPVSAWQVKDGELIATGDGYPTSGWLLTEQLYKDFVLRLEFQVSEGANSGVALRAVPGEGAKVLNGPPQHLEVQILDDDKYRLDKPGQVFSWTGSLFWSTQPNVVHFPAQTADLKPAGQWNEMVVEARGDSLQVWVNGRRIVNTDLDKLAKKPYAQAGLKRSCGRVGLQQHTGQVRFRNIEIKDLSAPKSPATKQAANDFLNPADWEGLEQFWTIKDGCIYGATGPGGLKYNTFLCSRKTFKDFDLRFQVCVTGKGWDGNSGVQIRSKLVDANKFIVHGPQADIGTGCWGSLWNEPSSLMKQALWANGDEIITKGGFNDYFIRCAGQHVTIRVNGRTTVDHDFAQLPAEGIIAWQLHGGGGSPVGPAAMTVTFRDIAFRELK